MESELYLMNEVLDSFGVKAHCSNLTRNGHFEFYDLIPSKGFKINSISAVATEIALAIKASSLPIINPILDKGIVRLKVTRGTAKKTILNDLFAKYKAPGGNLMFLFGETDNGEPMWVDMSENPHLLCAGGTGSGKSVFLHGIIANALRRNDVDLYISDPKSGVEFSPYENSVRMLVTSYDDTVNMLGSLELKMNQRYDWMRKRKCTNSFSASIKSNIVIIDELADLMLIDKERGNKKKGLLEKYLVSLAQKARAAGIFLILATQRPSVDIITGSIKANFPARLACRVSSSVDSKVILDTEGAESLLGKGDALFSNVKHDLTRLQIAFANPELTLGKNVV